MPTLVALIRGVNVGAHNKLPMAALRQELTDAGYGNVHTYLQSGNVIFDTARAEDGLAPDEIAEDLETMLASRFQLTVPVLIRSATEMAVVAASHPFGDRAAQPNRQLHVAFLSDTPSPDAKAKVDPHKSDPEELRIDGREIYMWCPDGLGRSRLLNGVERALGVGMTVRNWPTVTQLAEMASARDAGESDTAGAVT